MISFLVLTFCLVYQSGALPQLEKRDVDGKRFVIFTFVEN